MDPTLRKEESDLIKEMQDKCKLKKSNNNEEDFENVYATPEDSATNGRISGASNESAFSSGAGSDETENSAISDNNSNSGRSSANREQSSIEYDHKINLNPYCNLIPETEEASKLVDEVRVKFLEDLKDISNVYELYDKLDIDELKKPLPSPNTQEQSLGFRLISRYLSFHHINENKLTKKREKDVASAVENLKELLKLRQSFQLSTARQDQFSREFYMLSGIFPFGHDKNHTPVLYLRAHIHRRWSSKIDETFRRYIAWQINLITKSHHNAGEIKKFNPYNPIEKDGSFGICFDCINVSYSCLDMDCLRFLVRILVNYYPTYCRYAVCVDLPWLFRSVWKLVRSWLPEEAQKTVQLITSKELVEYIDEDQIPNSIRFNDKKASEKPVENKHQLPKNWDSIKGIDEFADELNISSTELKQLKSHVEKVTKEYKQLGAL